MLLTTALVLTVLGAVPASATFTSLSPGGAPSARRSTGMAEQQVGPNAANLWIFGGFTGVGARTELYKFDTATGNWIQVSGTGAPSARERHGFGFDPVHQRLIVFGGSVQSGFQFNPTNQLYAFDPATNAWALYSAQGTPPSARLDPAVVWAPSIGKFLVFGGVNSSSGNVRTNELWTLELDTANSRGIWTLLTPSGTAPSARNAVCAGFDSVGNKLVLFGGEGNGASALGGTFQYDVAANAWQTDAPTGTPPTARSFPQCAFDPVSRSLILYGGYDGNAVLGGTFAYDPVVKVWATYAPSPNPGTLSDAGAAYSSALGGILLFGGQSDVGTYVNGTWKLVMTPAGLNQPPVANAGPNQNVNEQVLVSLSGAGSSDPEGQSLSYTWTQTAGPSVTLNSNTAQQPTFTSPTVLQPATLTFSLVVNDGTQNSTPDSVDIVVLDNVNEPPVANAGGDQNVNPRVTVTLSGTSSDPNNDPMTVAWTQTAGPAVTLTGVGTPSPTFTSPATASGTSLSFQFTVTDSRGGTATDTVVVNVAADAPPSANAGPNQNLNEQVTVTLNGSASSDPLNQPLTYAWTQTAGPTVTLSSATVPQPTFTSPSVLQPTTLTFRLVVNDGAQASAPDTIDVVVQDNVNELPTVNAGADQNVDPNVTVTLSGAGADPNNEALSYAWTLTAGPAVTLSGASTASASFTSPRALAGSALTFQLMVTDARGGSANDQVVINVAADAPPVANAGPDQSVAEQAAVTLNGAGSSDPLNQPLTYAWTQTAGPSVTLSGANTPAPSFTAPSVTAPATLTFQLQVSDGLSTSADSVSISVQDSINEPPVANAGADQSVAASVTVVLDGAASSDPNAETLSWAWTQLSGTPVTLVPNGATATFTSPASDETLTFRLTVTDARGASASDDVSVMVTTNVNGPPNAVALVTPISGSAPLSVALDGTSSSAALTRTLQSWRWDPGDGTPPFSGSTAAHTYLPPGGYNLSLTVTDDAGASDTAKVQVSAGENGLLSPLARIIATPESGAAPLQVALSCACSDPQGRPLSYFWELGDGTTSASATVAHAFDVAGTYPVRLFVSNGALTTVDLVLVEVWGAQGTPPRARLFAQPAFGPAPLSTSFVVVANDGDGLIASQVITFHDGTTSSTTDSSFTYAAPGRYRVGLLVTDDSGLTAADSVEVVVTGSDGRAPPKIISTGARTGRVGDPYQYDADGRAEAVASGAVVWELGEPVPPNASIDSATGELRWTPDRAGTARLVILARVEGIEAIDTQVIDVEVEPIDPYSLVVGCGCGAATTPWPLAWIAFAALLVAARRRRA